MANENPSRDSASRQQSSDRSQSSGLSQQSSGTSSSQRSTSGTGPESQGTGRTSYEPGRSGAQGGQGSYGQGSSGLSGYGQGTSGQSGYGHGQQGQGSEYGQDSRGMSTWQGGRQGQGGALQRQGGSWMSPYGQEGYGGSGPFSLMRRISDEMDRFFENFGMGRSSFFPTQERNLGGEGAWGGQGAPSMWSPHIEMFERNGKLLIQADLPGIKRDDVNVRIEQDSVIIQGQRQQEQTANERGYYRSERSYGSFYRTIPLPEGTNADSATASFRDGVLEIEMDAPRQQQRGRTLEIREGGSQGSGSHGGHIGTGSGSTYGSGTSGSMQGSTSGGTGSPGSVGTQHVGSSATSGSVHTASAAGGTTASQQSASGSGSQYGSSSGTGQHAGSGSSGSGTMYSGSGSPSVGSAGTGSTSGSDRSSDRSQGSR